MDYIVDFRRLEDFVRRELRIPEGTCKGEVAIAVSNLVMAEVMVICQNAAMRDQTVRFAPKGKGPRIMDDGAPSAKPFTTDREQEVQIP